MKTILVTGAVSLLLALFGTPLIIRPGGQPQLLILASGGGTTADALQSLDPDDGRRLWWCRGAGEAASPAYGAGIVYFDSGRGGQGTAVEPTGEGDVSSTHLKWNSGQLSEGICSPIIVGEHVYRLHSPGVLFPIALWPLLRVIAHPETKTFVTIVRLRPDGSTFQDSDSRNCPKQLRRG